MVRSISCVIFSWCVANSVCAEEAVSAAKPGRHFHEVEADLHVTLRREATAKSFPERAAAVQDLAKLHQEIVSDARFSTSDTLKEYRGKVAVRLMAVRNELKRKLANKNGTQRRKETVAPNEIPAELENVLAANLNLAAISLGGPIQTLALDQRAPGGGIIDDGQTLVDLIEATINPRFWQVNGGPGSIFYFAPLRCLVVRATAEVHHNVGGLVEGLRDVGR